MTRGLVPGKGCADASPQLALGAHGAAGAGIRCSIAALAVEDIAGTANATVALGSQVTGSSTVVLLLERQGRTLAGLVDVAGSSNAAEEAARGSSRSSSVRGSLGVRALGGSGDVACTATSRTDVGGGRGGGLSDDVVGHGDGGVLGYVVVVVKMVAGWFISGVC